MVTTFIAALLAIVSYHDHPSRRGLALAGIVSFDKNITKTINATIKALDEKLSTQLNAIMHHPDFRASVTCVFPRTRISHAPARA